MISINRSELCALVRDWNVKERYHVINQTMHVFRCRDILTIWVDMYAELRQLDHVFICVRASSEDVMLLSERKILSPKNTIHQLLEPLRCILQPKTRTHEF